MQDIHRKKPYIDTQEGEYDRVEYDKGLCKGVEEKDQNNKDHQNGDEKRDSGSNEKLCVFCIFST